MDADTRTTSRGVTIGLGSRAKRITVHVALLAGVLVSVFPFYWLIVMASRTNEDIFRQPPVLVPGSHLLQNMETVLRQIDFFAALLNTVVVAVCGTALVLFFDSLAAFTFAKYEFPGKRTLFAILLSTFVFPAQLTLVPLFVTMAQFGWVGSFKALIIPGAASAFGTFWMRQYAQNSLPDELLDAGRIDGAGFFRLYWTVAVPFFRPALAFLGIFTFIALWNEYIWPLIILINPEKVTLQVALAELNIQYQADYAVIMAGALMSVVPLIGVFLLGARYLIRGFTSGGPML